MDQNRKGSRKKEKIDTNRPDSSFGASQKS